MKSKGIYLLVKFNIGFTLSEVLITLGIIGVVVAMTIPNLMTAFAKHRVETQLVKFYSTMNQAMRMSVADNDTPEGWITTGKSYSYNEVVEFLETYILPYLKHSGYEECTKKQIFVCVVLLSGGILRFSIDSNGGDVLYYIDGDITNVTPRNKFQFQFSKVGSVDGTINSQNYIEPYIYGWDGTREGLTKGTWACVKNCSNCGYCTKLIQLNSWKIPSDYPW